MPITAARTHANYPTTISMCTIHPPSQLPSYHQHVYKRSTPLVNYPATISMCTNDPPPVSTQYGCRLSNYQHASKLPQNCVNHTAVGKFRNTHGQEPQSKEKTHKLQNKSAPKKANNIKFCTAAVSYTHLTLPTIVGV